MHHAFSPAEMMDFVVRFLVFTLIHSALAMERPKTYVRRLSEKVFSGYRIGYNVLSLIMFGWVMAAYRDPPDIYVVTGAGSLVLRLIQGIILLILFRCAAQIGLGDFIGIDQLRGKTSAPHLVTTGCYRLVRHPQYTLAVAFLALNPVMSVKWLVLTILSTSYFIVGAVIEERRMMKGFGEEYTRYRNEVPMFIPGMKKARN